MNTLLTNPTVVGLLALVIAGIFVVSAVLWLRRSGKQRARVEPALFIDVGRLEADGPTVEMPRLEIYGTPVRVAVVVIAPAGRNSELPPAEVLPALLERLIPGLSEVIARDEPTRAPLAR